jgi:hypothetical protein
MPIPKEAGGPDAVISRGFVAQAQVIAEAAYRTEQSILAAVFHCSPQLSPASEFIVHISLQRLEINHLSF